MKDSVAIGDASCMNGFKRAFWILTVIMLFPLLASCGTTQERAGAVHMAVLSVSPWEDYANSLQPHYKMTFDEAMRKVAINTREYQEARAELTKAYLEIALASKKSASDTTSLNNLMHGNQFDNNSGAQKRPGVARPYPNLSSFEGMGQIPLDYMTHLKYAKALFEEVQLIDADVRNAALKKGCKPYIVRFQLSVMPRKKDESYSIDTLVSFFSPDPSQDTGSPHYKPFGTSTFPEFANVSAFSNITTRQVEVSAPIIIPLLVTDNMEGSSESLADSRIHQYAADIAAMINKIGVGGGYEYNSNDTKNILGREMNSLMSVGRVSDNTMRVRIGSYQTGTDKGLATFAGTHTITLLLLVPKNYKTITVMCQSKLLGEDGTVLASRTPKKSDKLLRRILNNYKIEKPDENDIDYLRGLLYQVQENDWAEFSDLISHPEKFYLDPNKEEIDAAKATAEKAVSALAEAGKAASDAKNSADKVASARSDADKTTADAKTAAEKADTARAAADNAVNAFKKLAILSADQEARVEKYKECFGGLEQNLWLDLVDAMVGSRYTSTMFDLPDRPEPRLPGNQTVFAIDDDSNTVIELMGGNIFDDRKIEACFKIEDIMIPPAKTEVEEGGNLLRFTFPSLKALNIVPQGTTNGQSLQNADLKVRYMNFDNYTSFPVACADKKPDEKPDTFMEYPDIRYVEKNPAKSVPSLWFNAELPGMTPDAKGDYSLQLDKTTTTGDIKLLITNLKETSQNISVGVFGCNIDNVDLTPEQKCTNINNSVAFSLIGKRIIATLHLKDISAGVPIFLNLVDEKNLSYPEIRINISTK